MKKALSILTVAALTMSLPAIGVPNYLQSPAPRQHTAAAPSSITVTTSSAQAVTVNLTRTGFKCTNLGTVTVFAAYGSNAAILNGGNAIFPGATWWMDDYEFTTQSVNMIASASANVACQEFN